MDRILGIICAMEEELEPLMDGFDMSRTVPKAGMEFLHGYLNGLESVARRQRDRKGQRSHLYPDTYR